MGVNEHFSLCLPVDLRFGCGVLDEVAKEKIQGKRAAIISGGNTIRKNGTLGRLEAILRHKCDEVLILDGVEPNPTRKWVMDAATKLKENTIGVVFGIGGGSAMDAAKAAAIMVPNEGDLWDYTAVGSGKGRVFEKAALPLYLIPTTAGTGSEGNKTAVITNEETHEKVGIRANYPTKGFVDPELTLSVPSRFTALQGFDAFCHCLEAFVSKKANPASDPWCLQGMREGLEWLPEAVRNGSNIEARSHVAWMSSLGGMVLAMSSSSTTHSIAHALGGLESAVEHGAALSAVSYAFHRIQAEQVPYRYAEIADSLGLCERSLSVSEKASCFIAHIKTLLESCGLWDLRLSHYGYTTGDVPRLIEYCYMLSGGSFTKDRYTISESELEQILLLALGQE